MNTKLTMALTFLTFANGVLLAEDTNERQLVIPANSQASFEGPEQYFTGDVHVQMIPPNKEMLARGGLVTFAPNARSNWHIHSAGQLLIVTDSIGLTQEWGGTIRVIKKGDVVWCPPGVKHWHGASPDSSMTHIALSANTEDATVTWLEPVSDKQYHEENE